jgi:hypothetical protein
LPPLSLLSALLLEVSLDCDTELLSTSSSISVAADFIEVYRSVNGTLELELEDSELDS